MTERIAEIRVSVKENLLRTPVVRILLPAIIKPANKIKHIIIAITLIRYSETLKELKIFEPAPLQYLPLAHSSPRPSESGKGINTIRP
jgi:hypothetical protein